MALISVHHVAWTSTVLGRTGICFSKSKFGCSLIPTSSIMGMKLCSTTVHEVKEQLQCLPSYMLKGVVLPYEIALNRFHYTTVHSFQFTVDRK